ncbi:MAG: TrmH family RNA methyltransferase [Clostridiaceae bacterium]|nr:TrmH family RNA methyltransferase [Clostridiaceae bacterium]
MNEQRIYSKNAAWQKFEVLKTNRPKRYHYHQFFVEGVRAVNEAVRNHWQIDSWIYSYETKLSDWAAGMLSQIPTEMNYALTAGLMAELSGKTDTSELCAIVRMREDNRWAIPSPDATPKPLAAVFDRPSNKGNLGTLIRSCDALGIDCLALTGHAVDLYDPEILAASMGSFFKVPVLRLTDNVSIEAWIADWRKAYPDFQMVGTTSHREQPVYRVDLTRPTLLVIGNETEGMSRWFYEHCDQLATIPMNPASSASSFNVACAATVLFYEAIRQRQTEAF